MTRRYGWRALLKAMKVEGTHKESELEIKILPVHKLSKAKQVSVVFVHVVVHVTACTLPHLKGIDVMLSSFTFLMW